MLFEESLGFDAAMSRLLAAINGTEYWLSAVVAMFFVERYGRYFFCYFQHVSSGAIT